MSAFPCLVRSVSPSGETRYALGDPLVDRYLAFVAGRCRAETLRATAFDLKTFFTVVTKAPVDVVASHVFEFLAHQRGDRSVVRISDREPGLSPRTIARRLSSVSGFYAHLVARGDTTVVSNPMPANMSRDRTTRTTTRQGCLQDALEITRPRHRGFSRGGGDYPQIGLGRWLRGSIGA